MNLGERMKRIRLKKGITFSLGVEPAYLMGWIPEDEEIMTSSKYIHLPTAISAGLPLNVEAITEAGKISIPDSIMGKWAGSKGIMVLNVNGDSMDKIIPDGSLIAVKPVGLTELKNGAIVVFSNGYEYSVKRYYKHDDKLVFRPESSNLAHYDQTYSIIYSITAKKIRGQLSPLFFISMRKKTLFLMFSI